MTKGTKIHTLELGPMANFVYIIEDEATATAAVIDPAWDTVAIDGVLEQRGLKLTDILLTHSHHDHINGIDDLLQKHDAQVHLNKEEARFWQESVKGATEHRGGDLISVGETELTLWHTPGHTPGSACYRLNDTVFTGDTVFVYGCGRCDLKGGEPETMYTTLQRLKKELPAETVVRPGHNYAHAKPVCTWHEQLEGNPFMHMPDKDSFVEFRMHTHNQLRASPYLPVSDQDTMAMRVASTVSD